MCTILHLPFHFHVISFRRSKYQVIFDPRCRRASNKGAAAQAEHVTGTHLFEYLQDAAIAGSAGPNSGAESTDKTTEIYEVKKKENIIT